jgi:electron transfer flavoprotein beta subunit
MAVKKKTIETIDAAGLGISTEEVGAAGAKITFREIMPPPERKPGQIVEGEPAEAVQKLVKLLREEAKVI